MLTNPTFLFYASVVDRPVGSIFKVDRPLMSVIMGGAYLLIGVAT